MKADKLEYALQVLSDLHDASNGEVMPYLSKDDIDDMLDEFKLAKKENSEVRFVSRSTLLALLEYYMLFNFKLNFTTPEAIHSDIEDHEIFEVFARDVHEVYNDCLEIHDSFLLGTGTLLEHTIDLLSLSALSNEPDMPHEVDTRIRESLIKQGMDEMDAEDAGTAAFELVSCFLHDNNSKAGYK